MSSADAVEMQVHPSNDGSNNNNNSNSNNDHANGNSQGERAPTSKFTNFVLHHHWVVIISVFVFVVICFVLWQNVVVIGEKNNASGGQFLPIDDIAIRRFFAYIETGRRRDKTVVPELSDTHPFYQMTVYYSHTGGAGSNVLTPTLLRAIYETELQLQGLDSNLIDPANRRSVKIDRAQYVDFCQHQYNYTNSSATMLDCKPVFSVINDVIFRDQPSFTHQQVIALNQSFIDSQLTKFMTTKYLDEGNSFFLGKEFSVTKPHLKSWVARSLFNFGIPLKGYKYYTIDNDKEQNDRHLAFMRQYTKFFEQRDPPNLRVNYLEMILSNAEIGDLVDGDFVWATVAGLSVYLLIVAQTQSWFLASLGMLNILMSYPVAMTCYHGVLQIEIDTVMNLLAIYVILGIGADDIFVYVDAWKQSVHESDKIAKDPEARVYWVWKRAASAMLVTSLTTFVAFVMTATSPIPSISAFGIVAGLMVLFNYLFVISFFPAVVVVWDKWNCHKRGCCFMKKVCVPMPEHDDEEQGDHGVQKHGGATSQSSRLHKDVDVSEHRAVERFFYLRAAPFLNRFKRQLVVAFIAVFVLFVSFAAQLQPPSEVEFGLPDDAELVITLKLANNDFPPTGETFSNPKVFIFWGINPDDPLDQSGIDRNAETNLGTIVLSKPSEFELINSTINYIDSVCRRLQTERTPETNLPFLAEGQDKCWTTEFLPWNAEQQKTSPIDMDDPAAVAKRIQDFLAVGDNKAQYKATFGGLVNNDNPTRVTWTRVELGSAMPVLPTRSERDSWFDEWARLMKDINAKAPPKARHGFQTSEMWTWKRMNDVIVSSTIISVLVSFVVASAVLVVSTGNLIVAGFASLTIVGIVSSILGLVVMLGRSLGIIESICATILVGLAVDFVVHLGHSYNEALVTGRFYRARSALLEMGISVTGGAITTMTAAFFLFFTILSFFQTFGLFIFVTIGFSYLWTMCFFIPSMMLVGPMHKPIGDIDYLWKHYVRKSIPAYTDKAGATDLDVDRVANPEESD